MTAYYFQGEMGPKIPSQDKVEPEKIELHPEFKYIKQDLEGLFNIEIENEEELNSAHMKNKLYEKVVEDLNAGKPFALDYMLEERAHGNQLLNRKDLQMRGIYEMKPQAKEILMKIKGPIGRRMKDHIVYLGILSEEEANTIFTSQ